MQEYLQKTPLGAVMDEIGTALLLFCGSMLFYVLLWGINLAALTAGLATFVLWFMLRARTREQRLRRREQQLRWRIGGELKMEAWSTLPSLQAHFETAQLLSTVCPLRVERVLDAGALCRSGEKGARVLVACAQLHRRDRLTAREVAAFQRACACHHATQGILCGAGGAESAAEEQAQLFPPITLIGREKMIALAGRCHPASDRQLVELGRRKRMSRSLDGLRERVLSAERAKKYLLYALLMLGMAFFSGQSAYVLPAMICLALMTLSRVHAARSRETLLSE